MRVLHTTRYAPAGGLYHTVSELAQHERAAGIDAVLWDANDGASLHGFQQDFLDRAPHLPPNHPPSLDDVDLIADHGGCPAEWSEDPTPRVSFIHGCPLYCFRREMRCGKESYTSVYLKGKHPVYKRVVTFWPEHADALELLTGKAVCQIPPPVNLDYWKPGPDEHEWRYLYDGENEKPLRKLENATLRGRVNIAVVDSWREDKDPFWVLHALARLAGKVNGLRIHLYGVPSCLFEARKKPMGLDPLIARLREMNVLGEVLPKLTPLALRKVYRSADIVASCRTAASRIIRESLACGAQLVAGHNNRFTPYSTVWEDIDDSTGILLDALEEVQYNKKKVVERSRQTAEAEFDPVNTAEAAIEIYQDVLR